MAGMKFTADVNVEDIIKLRQEIDKLKKSLIAIAGIPNSDSAIKQLEKEIAAATKKLEEYENKYLQIQKLKHDIDSSNDAVKKAKEETAALQSTNKWIVANTEAVIETDKQIKQLKKSFVALADSEKTGTSGIGILRQVQQLAAQRLVEEEAVRKTIKAQKDQIIQSKAEEGSITALRKQIILLTKDYDDLGRTRRNGDAGKALLAQIANVQKELSAAEQASGRFQRNVGNYASAWNGLGFSVQQVARELPSLAVSANTFFLAISNNLPILVDEIAKARKEYAAFKAELAAGNKDVKAVAPVWQQLTKSLISWQTALVVGLTLLSVYGKEIINWGKELVRGKNYVLDLSTAEQELAAARKKGIQDSIKERLELDLLYTKLKSASTLLKERTASINEWISKYPQYANVINEEKIDIDKLSIAYRALGKEMMQRSIYQSYMDRAKDISNQIVDQEIKLRNQTKTLKEANKRVEEANKRLFAAQKNESDTYSSLREKNAAQREFTEANKNLEEQARIYSDINNNVSKLKGNLGEFINSIDVDKLFPQPKEGTYDYWQQQVQLADTALKQIKDTYLKTLKSGNTNGVPEEVVKQYNALIKQKTEAEEKLKLYDDKGLTKEYNSIVDQQKKISELLYKQATERKRKEQDLENQLTQSRIDAMAEGEAKIRAQRELDNKKEIQDLERQREDYIRTEIELQRKAFDEQENLRAKQTKNYKKRTFDPSGVSVDTTAWDAIIKNTQKRQAVDWYRPLLKQYQSYADQRLAIEKQFNDDIALLRKAREKAEKAGDTNEISKIDRSIAKAISDKGKELMQHDFDILKKSPEYVRAFEDLKNTSSETLKSLLEQLEEAKGAAVTVLDPNDLREYTSTIQKIMDELDSRNPFKALADNLKILKQAEKELIEAKSTLDKVNAGEKVVSGSKLNTKTGKIDTTYFSASEALKRYNAAKDKATKANNDFIKAEKAAKAIVDKLANAITGVGDSISGTSGEIISLIGNIALFTTNAIDGIATVAQIGKDAITAAEKAVAAVEKASVILGIISAGIQLMQQLNSILPTADNQYEKYAEKVAEINKLTEAVNEYRIAALEAQQAESKWFSEDNLRNLRDYKDLHDEVAKAYKTKAEESQAIYQNKSGGGWITNSWNWLLDNTYGKIWGIDFGRKYREGQTAAINNLRIETRKRSKGFLGTGIGGHSQETEDLVSWARRNGFGELFDNDNLINKETAETILNNYGDKLVGQTKETLEALLELREKYDEYTQQLHEYVSSLYEPLVDNFVDSLWAWFDEGKDALDSFKDYASDTFRDIVSDMLRTIVLDKVVGSFSEDIATLYEGYASGKLDEEALMRKVAERTEGLVDNYENNLPTLERILENVNEYLNKAGIDLREGASTSQESSKKGFATMSQDSADELNGRFTALQIAGEEIKNQNQLQTMSILELKAGMLTISANSSGIKDIASETRDLIRLSYEAITDIRDNTNVMVKPIQQMAADIAEVKRNTNGLSKK